MPTPHPRIGVSLSSSSVYPQGCQASFRYCADLGFDGVEIMVWADPATQDVTRLARWAKHYNAPVTAIHAPTLLLTQLVWGLDPWVKVERSAQMAVDLGAETVVVHPPFRWQPQYAAQFADGIARIKDQYHIAIAVENMFPWRTRGKPIQGYLPGWDPCDQNYADVTLDLSHTATSQSDAMAMVQQLGQRLRHLHLADGSGSAKDEHLLPGHGSQPCAQVLQHLATHNFTGHVVLEVSTRFAGSTATRTAQLGESLKFARTHLDASAASRQRGLD